MIVDFQYFTKEEFACKCGCGCCNIDLDFVRRLEIARKEAGVPFIINSGCRCARHNRAVGGKETSSHLRGIAADIRAVTNGQRHAVMRGLVVAGFRRIGIAKTFVHVDTDSGKPGRVVWLYQ